jgi:hypothetical protein
MISFSVQRLREAERWARERRKLFEVLSKAVDVSSRGGGDGGGGGIRMAGESGGAAAEKWSGFGLALGFGHVDPGVDSGANFGSGQRSGVWNSNSE